LLHDQLPGPAGECRGPIHRQHAALSQVLTRGGRHREPSRLPTKRRAGAVDDIIRGALIQGRAATCFTECFPGMPTHAGVVPRCYAAAGRAPCYHTIHTVAGLRGWGTGRCAAPSRQRAMPLLIFLFGATWPQVPKILFPSACPSAGAYIVPGTC